MPDVDVLHANARANEVAVYYPHKMVITAGEPEDKEFGEMAVTIETTRGDLLDKRRVKSITWVIKGKAYSVPAKELQSLEHVDLKSLEILSEEDIFDPNRKSYVYLHFQLKHFWEEKPKVLGDVWINLKGGKLQPMRMSRSD